MRNTIIILLFPFFSASQSTVDSMGNIVGYVKTVDSVKYFASKYRADSIINGLVTFINTQAALKAPLASPAFTGTATGIGLPVYARVTGLNATTTGQSLVTITGLSLSLVANATYEIEVMLSVSTTAVTTGTGYGINYSAAGATIEGFVQGALTNATDKTLRLNAFNTSSQAWLTTSAQTGGVLIKATVTVGANAGTLTAQHLKVTSGTSTCFIGSYLKAIRIL